MRKIVLIADNIRSAYNVGSLLRTADGLGAVHVYLTGYSARPPHSGDVRLPHEQTKAAKQIHKTALGAENTVAWSYMESIENLITALRLKGYLIAALEQTPSARKLHEFIPPDKIALILGNEIAGISQNLLTMSDAVLEIPMAGAKESFNVSVAAAIALYYLAYSS